MPYAENNGETKNKSTGIDLKKGKPMVNCLGYDDEYLMELRDALSYLPFVKPRKAREKMNSWLEELVFPAGFNLFADQEESDSTIDIGGGIILKSDDFEHLKCEDGFSAAKVTPEGAELLIRIYQAGLFELQARKSIQEVSDEIIKYSQSRESILAKQESDEIRRTEELKKKLDLIEHPEKIKLEEFSYKLLNEVFINRFGLGERVLSMMIGGILVTKSVTMFSSNSGKTRDSEVTFSWIAPDGQRKELKKGSIFANNRRNDSDRNWGLPE